MRRTQKQNKKEALALLPAVLFVLGSLLVPSPVSADAETGDLDGDGRVSAADARLVARFVSGISDAHPGYDDLDADLDGAVTFDDALFLLRLGVGKEKAPDLLLSGEREPEIPSRAAVMLDVTENRLLYRKNPDERLAPASLTKLLTAITALTLMPENAACTVGDEIDLIGANSSVCYLQKGWTLPLSSLLAGMLTASGNDAAYSVAVNAARYARLSDGDDSACVSAFVEKMNAVGKDLGLRDSVFLNPDGYDEAGHETTVRDLLILSKAAIRFPAILTATGEHEKTVLLSDGTPVSWTSTNRLLDPEDEYFLPDAKGLKTGTTPDAGYCLAALIGTGERTVLFVTVGNDTDDDRYRSVHTLLDAVA